MKTLKTLSAVAVALAAASPALAHDGEHSHSFFATAIHWLSSPTHSLFAVIGGVVISALIYKAVKKKA
ncbi:hypothetical protein N9W89_05780 [Hellea sp.]|nr:hypothetical protein [Hellea sp.]